MERSLPRPLEVFACPDGPPPGPGTRVPSTFSPSGARRAPSPLRSGSCTMNSHPVTSMQTHNRTACRSIQFLGLLLAGAVLAACGGSGGGSQSGGNPGDPGPGSGEFSYPEGFESSPAGFFVDPNKGGQGSSLRIAEAFWGRLVDVYDTDAITGVQSLQYRNYVIGENIQSDGNDFVLEANPVTQQENLIILHEFGTVGFDQALAQLDDNLGPIVPKGLATFELPPFPFFPRNGVLVVRFDDMLDHDSVAQNTVRITTGYPPVEPFETRLILDPNFGGLINGEDGKEFRTTRVIIDMSVSQFEAQSVSPPLAVNTVGLPAAITTASPNVALRIPTQTDPTIGQFTRLTNVSGHPLAFTGNGPVDTTVSTNDVVRALRSGGSEEVTGDDFNGFLRDEISPRILGSAPVTVAIPPGQAPPVGPGPFDVNLTFQSANCAQTPVQGDIIELAGTFLQVTAPATAPSAGVVQGVEVEVVAGVSAGFVGGAGLYRSAFEPGEDLPECFVLFNPEPGGFPNNAVDPSSEIILTLSEPADPESVSAFDSFVVTRGAADPLLDVVIGSVEASTNLREFTYRSLLPFSHTMGNAETYFVDIQAGPDGITDLAGNPLQAVPGQLAFMLDSAAATDRNGGLVLRFTNVDEDGDGSAELNGQFVLNPQLERVTPRPVARFQAPADNSMPVPALMTSNVNPVNEPLAPLGARVMTSWRLVDMGLDVEDASIHNIDVERLHWAPQSGAVNFEDYPEFEIGLSHSNRLPDETNDPVFLVAFFPLSGLLTTAFDLNVLDDPENELAVVHDRADGYTINPVNTFMGVSGRLLHPFPLNSGPDPNQYEYYTWRDTTIQSVAGTAGGGTDLGLGMLGIPPYSGIPMSIEVVAGTLTEPLDIAGIQGPDGINSIGLPLLMDFKCFPTGATTLSVNSFDTSLAVPMGINSPFFRIFSAGGVNAGGTPVTKDPDLQPMPTGGFNPASVPSGAPTPGTDTLFYAGQADFVVRVSHMFTRFLDTTNQNSVFLNPVQEPLPDDQPAGTEVIYAYRGASIVQNLAMLGNPANDASILDTYGDQPNMGTPSDPTACPPVAAIPPPIAPETKNQSVTFTNGGFSWSEDVLTVSNSRYLQVRVTFVSNTASGVSPGLDSLGIPFQLP